MKKILLILACALIVGSCGAVDDKYYERPQEETEPPVDPPVDPIPDDPAYWEAAAEIVSERAISSFWRNSTFGTTNRRNTFAASYTPPNTRDTGYQYWPQAHAMDVVIDAYLRTRDPKYLEYYDAWFAGVKVGNGNSYKNQYVDDMEWIVLTMLRMYETTEKEEYFTTAKQIYDDWIWTEWSEIYPSNGGILWNTAQGSKDACSNGPGGVIACKLATLVDDPDEKAEYTEQARKIYEWLKSVLIKPNYGVMNSITAGGSLNESVLTYNQGTVLGTAHGLYMLTRDDYYMDEAIKLAEHVTIQGGCCQGGDRAFILRNEGDPKGDLGLFKGIFVRYFVRFINDTDVPLAKRKQFYGFLARNANTLWTEGFHEEGNYRHFANGAWWEPIPETGSVGLQGVVSGATLLEGMAAVNPVP